ncbi:Stressosome protein rsbRB [Fictibacillus iocasae]|uniref:Stressosome protein rsbRB n=1 Tax=Fictibacillus iocasae TaxID=2715437 RepID=A0ABW2NQQ4_9BACL
MPFHEKYLPVPYMKIDEYGNILNYSDEASALFSFDQLDLKALLDEESIAKLLKNATPSLEKKCFELHFQTKDNPLALFDVHLSWDHEHYGHLVAMPKDNTSSSRVIDQLALLQQRLSSTNFELFEKKEMLEKTLHRMNVLSGPFIAITEKVALVPLFGDLNGVKMSAITLNVIKRSYEGDYDEILFDFSGVGEIHEDGVRKFCELFDILMCMSSIIIRIAGIKPFHAQSLNQLGFNLEAYYESSVKEVVRNAN